MAGGGIKFPHLATLKGGQDADLVGGREGDRVQGLLEGHDGQRGQLVLAEGHAGESMTEFGF